MSRRYNNILMLNCFLDCYLKMNSKIMQYSTEKNLRILTKTKKQHVSITYSDIHFNTITILYATP